jgi:hypothetical protein
VYYYYQNSKTCWNSTVYILTKNTISCVLAQLILTAFESHFAFGVGLERLGKTGHRNRLRDNELAQLIFASWELYSAAA